MREEISKNVNDPLVDLTQIKDQGVDDVSRKFQFLIIDFVLLNSK